ncbi:GNAT family acetyltransferase [Methylobacterium sp. Leaf112]|uniref:GNAT family acetyltransferase n=1 Tax=Methylobacterium sp. Leaf112 TaxID=1736258 RepID=UPI0007007258|nr:GNAT family acetyltransferase [Methylobacterium sp. Leaf112]KQP60730.1 acetyltransferase [Methylobacterium sp. Leaf112]USU34024.1 GNAT family acetyltransferase [Methylobacterium sp. OTU13CASTA1]
MDTTESLTIRPFRADDHAAVIALWRACGLVVPHNDPDADLDRAAGRPNSDVLVGVTPDGRVAASVMVGHDGHRGWLYYVAAEARGRGHGRAMVAAGEEWLRVRKIPKAQLMIRETNTPVRDFYAGLGWNAVPRIVMERWL